MIGNLSRWNPTAEVTDHRGEALPRDMMFFAAPPAEIGEIVSAYCPLKLGQGPRSIGARLAIAALFGLIGGLLGYALSLAKGGEELREGLVAGFAAVPAVIAFFVSGKRPVCSFVGTKGIARYKLLNDSGQTNAGDIFLFESAEELRTSQTRMYHNGIYTGTEYSYTWSDAAGKKVYKLSGNYYSRKKPPSPKSDYHYAVAAEVAWSNHYLQRAQQEMAKNGWVRFRLLGNDCVYVARGFLEAQVGGKSHRIEADEIGGVNINQGYVTLSSKDAKRGFLGIGGTGYVNFAYSNLANARVCFLMLARMIQQEAGVNAR